MTIEIHAPEGQVKEWLIGYLKEELTALHRRQPVISRAEVHLREAGVEQEQMHICEIAINAFGEAIFVRREGDSFEVAARHAMEEVKEMVEKQTRRQSEPPDEVIITVDV